jgi:outer membrane biogenesis lipoprotein LolB
MRRPALALAILAALLLTGCTTSVEDAKTEEKVGDTVTLVGTAKSPTKIGPLSGYVLEGQTGTIPVATEDLPEHNQKVRVSGTVMRDTILGYYLKAE